MSDTENQTYSYRGAGVDIDSGAALVNRIKQAARSTRRPGADAVLGGFGGFFDLKATGFRDPLLVAATDGVGTKLKIGIDTGILGGLGIDLVAMCVNDLIVQGASPLFFLDYFATGKLDIEKTTSIIEGVADGCRQAGCALIGGETAEMPGLYQPGDFDLAGFAVGAVERDSIIDGSTIEAGDYVLGLSSSGIHSNGFSLVRQLVSDHKLELTEPAPFDSATDLGASLLTPTRIYVASIAATLSQTAAIKGLAHITGGGLLENIPRILPEGMAAMIDAGAWTFPPVFDWLRQIGRLTPEEMARTFNCGIGMVAVVGKDDADRVKTCLESHGEPVTIIGEIAPRAIGEAPIHINGTAGAWGITAPWQLHGGTGTPGQ